MAKTKEDVWYTVQRRQVIWFLESRVQMIRTKHQEEGVSNLFELEEISNLESTIERLKIESCEKTGEKLLKYRKLF